jgi:hypothetical protein
MADSFFAPSAGLVDMVFNPNDQRRIGGRQSASPPKISEIARFQETMAQASKSAGPGGLRSKLILTRRTAVTAPGSASLDEWLAASADEGKMVRAGIKPRGGGPHQSKTMMLAELTTLLVSPAADRPAEAIVRDNLLGKPSVRAREAALYRLRQLYGIGETWPICVVLHRLWDRDPPGRPLLALLCALARDPALRAGASAVLNASLGEHVRWPMIAAAFEACHPGRLGEKMAKSLAQNAASSWTQSGSDLCGRVHARPLLLQHRSR